MRKLDKTLKIIIMIVLVFTSIIVSNPKSYAASASISCASSIETNKPLVISVTGTGVQWHLVLKVNGTVIAESSELDNYESNKSINFTGTYTPTSAGTLNVELSGSVTEHSDGSTITSFSSRTVTVTEPKPDPTPTPTPDPEPDPEPAPDPTPTPTPTPGKNETVPNETNNNKNNTTNNNKEKTKSSNEHLGSLKIDKGTLTPQFNRDRQEYSVTFDDKFDYKTLTSLKVTAKAEDSKATVSGAGDIAINEGDNNIEIKCTAENGNTRIYKIKVTKPVELKQSDLRLKSLTINKVDEEGKFIKASLDKDFDPEVFEYTCDVESNISDLDINAEVENTEISVVITGNDNLTVGTNTVLITLTSPTDDTVQTMYKIIVNKAEEIPASTDAISVEPTTKDNKSKIIATAIGVIIILVIVLIILIIVNHKKNKIDDYDTADDDDNEEELKNRFGKIEDKLDDNILNANTEESKTEKVKTEESEKEDYKAKGFKAEDYQKEESKNIIEEETQENKKTGTTNKYTSKLDELFETKKGYDKEEDPYDFKIYEKEEKKKENAEEFLKDIKNKKGKGKHF